jgi:hypothetical protein
MVHGAAETLYSSGLPEDEVLNLIPIHPLKDNEATIQGVFESSLEPLYRKLTISS